MKLKLESIANLFLIGGAVVISVSPEFSTKWWIFLAFFFGHAVWIWHGRNLRDAQLIQLNVAMLALDAYAMFVRI